MKKQAHAQRKIPIWGKVVNSSLYERDYAESKTSYEIGGGLRIIPDDRCLARWVNHQPQGNHHAALKFVCTRKENFRDLRWDEVYLELSKKQKAFADGTPKEMFFSYAKSVEFKVKMYKPVEDKGGPFPDVTLHEGTAKSVKKGAPKGTPKGTVKGTPKGSKTRKRKAPESDRSSDDSSPEETPRKKNKSKQSTPKATPKGTTISRHTRSSAATATPCETKATVTAESTPQLTQQTVSSPILKSIKTKRTTSSLAESSAKKKHKVNIVESDPDVDVDDLDETPDPPEPVVHKTGHQLGMVTCGICHTMMHRDEMEYKPCACGALVHAPCLVDGKCPACHQKTLQGIIMMIICFSCFLIYTMHVIPFICTCETMHV